MGYRDRPKDETPLRQNQLNQLISWLIPVTFVFALILLGSFVILRDVVIGAGGTVLLAYGLLLLLARAQIRRGHSRQAVALICGGLLAATLVAVVVEPAWLPVLAVTPLLAVMVALPYVGDSSLLRFIAAGWLMTMIVGVLGQVLLPSSEPPLWFERAFVVCSLGAAVPTVLLLLWQF